MKKTVLKFDGVTKRFPGVLALDHVSFELRESEILGLCGENGAGKSTLMKILSGSYHGDFEGDIYVYGEKQPLASVEEAQKLGIEMIYQETSVMLEATVAENLFVGNLPGKYVVDFKKLYSTTRELLDFAGINVDPREKVRHLNNGQIQMLSILRAWSKKPRILILDEPTGALTNNETKLLMGMLRKLRDDGISCIYISHKLEEVYEITDRVVVLRDGKTVAEHQTSEVAEEKLISEMVGRKVENLYPEKKAEIGEEIFRVENLTVPHPTLAGSNIVENISFSVRRGEILGIGGLVGAGRSEALSAIFGLIREGVTKKVYIKGKEVQIRKPLDAIKNGIGYVTEDRKQNGFIGNMSIRKNLTLTSLKRMPGRVVIDRKSEEKAAQQMFDRLRVKAPSSETLLQTLSGGNQQKIVVGRWLLSEPDILFIDEPTRGVDVGAKTEIYEILEELTERGMAIVMVSSDMPELVSMSDRCIVISNKHITGELMKEDITQDRVMAAAIRQI